MMNDFAQCRAITALEYEIANIHKLCEDMVELDKSNGFEHDDDHALLLKKAECLKADFLKVINTYEVKE